MNSDAEVEYDLKSGDVIAGKYRVDEELGRGGMGVVVAATHIDLDQRVAIKILKKSSAYDRDAMTRFLREARSAAKIRSEHVARVMDVGKLEDGLTYIVMEHLDGSDLADVLREEGPFKISTAADYMLQACEGIAAAHAAGIIHRDIKPANIFLARQPGRANTVKILDFGVSKIAKNGMQDKEASASQSGQVFGSPMYMSPEQVECTIAIDCRTDIWSLGVVLFELLAGQPPFGGRSSANIMTAVMRDPPLKLRSLRPDAPAALEEVVARCLEKERDNRYTTVIDLAEAIAPFCGKGADDTVNRIYQILAHAASGEPDSRAGTTLSGEKSESRLDTPSRGQLDRRDAGALALTERGQLPVSMLDRPIAQRRTAIIVVVIAAVGLLILLVVGRAGHQGIAETAGSVEVRPGTIEPLVSAERSPVVPLVTTAATAVAPPPDPTPSVAIVPAPVVTGKKPRLFPSTVTKAPPRSTSMPMPDVPNF